MPGPAGATGPAGPGAAAIRYSVQASETPTSQTALDFHGLELSAMCQKIGAQTMLGLSILSTEAAVIHENSNVDFGEDLNSPGQVQTGTLSIELQPGVALDSGLPPVDAPNYGRASATLLYVSDTRVMTLTVVLMVNAADETCRLLGTAVPAS